jgi:hypothetical protein
MAGTFAGLILTLIVGGVAEPQRPDEPATTISEWWTAGLAALAPPAPHLLNYSALTVGPVADNQ